MKFLQYKTKNYYDLLQVPETATQDDIKKSFFHLAKQYHPDVNHEPEAANIFKEINEAFQVIGNETERKLYDQIRHSVKISSDHFVKTATTQTQESSEETSAGKEEKEAYQKETEQIHSYRKKLVIAAIARTIIVTIVATIIAYGYTILVQIVAWAFVGLKLNDLTQSIQVFLQTTLIKDFLWNENTIGALFSGSIIGIISGIDSHFKIETFITHIRMKKTYHLLRTLLFTLAFAYLFVMLYFLLSVILKQEILWLKIVFIILGLLIGSTMSSDGNFPLRVKTKEGWKELLFIFLRNFGFGFLGACIGGILALMFGKMFEQDAIFMYMPLTGFAILTGLGATSEEEIANMIREIDKGTKRMLFISIIVIMLVVGAVAGFFLGKIAGL